MVVVFKGICWGKRNERRKDDDDIIECALHKIAIWLEEDVKSEEVDKCKSNCFLGLYTPKP